MGTEVAISFSTLRAQLETEKSSLFKIDENIKKIVQTSGRFPNDRLNTGGEFNRGNGRAARGFPEAANNFNNKNDEHSAKRKTETKTVFSRLSARSPERAGGPARRVQSAVSREAPCRAAVLRAAAGDSARDRRMFGALLGTLQKFRQEELSLQTKEEKRAQVERKIEEQARQQKEKEQRERKTLFAERELKRATIKALEAKLARVQEFEAWEEMQRPLTNFILTRSKPHVYWLPKRMNAQAGDKLAASRNYHDKCMSRKRQELQEELQRIEQRCLRQRGPGAKENQPHAGGHGDRGHGNMGNDDMGPGDGGQDGDRKKRDKFAAEVEKDDSEDEHHDDKMETDQHHDVKMDAQCNDKENETVKPQSEASHPLASDEPNEQCELPPIPGEEPRVDPMNTESTPMNSEGPLMNSEGTPMDTEGASAETEGTPTTMEVEHS